MEVLAAALCDVAGASGFIVAGLDATAVGFSLGVPLPIAVFVASADVAGAELALADAIAPAAEFALAGPVATLAAGSAV